MESALYGINALVVFVSEILLVRCAHSFDFWYVNNSRVNTVRQHFPWSILYLKDYTWYKSQTLEERQAIQNQICHATFLLFFFLVL